MTWTRYKFKKMQKLFREIEDSNIQVGFKNNRPASIFKLNLYESKIILHLLYLFFSFFFYLYRNIDYTQRNVLFLFSSVKSSADKLSISMLSAQILMVQKLFWECIFKCTNSLWSWNLTFTYRIPKWTLFSKLY